MRTLVVITLVSLSLACAQKHEKQPDAGGIGGSGGVGGTSGSGGGGTGGVGGSGGVGGVGGSGGVGGGECQTAADCKLLNDCCICKAAPLTDPDPPFCPGQCLIDTCSSLGVSAVACVAGRCVLDISCNATEAVCRLDPTPCPAGQAHTIVNGCFGGCIDVRECSEVTSCDVCSSDLVCVSYPTRGNIDVRCVEPPNRCNGSPSCACMGDTVCVDSFNICSDTNLGISCGCPTC